MKARKFHFPILTALVFAPWALFAQVQFQVQQGGVQQGQEAPAPKFVAALGWDRATQGGFPTCVIADAQNNIWVGTEGKGLWCYNARDKKWKQFTAKDDGLGDDCIYALAADKLGRVWAGHLNHGVSVWNGEKWKNYGIVDGPIGNRVFSIATCPTDGDVWIATELGVTRYSLKNNDWDYFTRASGLPSDQIQAIAFNAKGTIYLGTQCDGVAFAAASDNYKKWTVIDGPFQMPNVGTGQGMSTSLVNHIAVVDPPNNVAMNGETGRVIIPTPVGISTISHGNGERLINFLRGEDWQENENGLFDPPPAPPNAQPMIGGAGGPIIIRGGGVLIINGRVAGGAGGVVGPRIQPMEDWVTCIRQEKETGSLWAGYRRKGLEIRNFGITPAVRVDTGGLDTFWVRSIWLGPKTPPLVAVYDEQNGGLFTLDNSKVQLEAIGHSPKTAPPFPDPAKAPEEGSITPLQNQIGKFTNEINAGEAIFLGDDWTTGGDWAGHYGTSYAMLCGSGKEGIFEGQNGYKVNVELGPHDKETKLNTSVQSESTDDPAVLYHPTLGHRVEGEVDDGSADKEKYPLSWEGPDLWLTVSVPDGVHIMSMYFHNNDAHTGGTNKLRDYDIRILTPEKTKPLTLKGDPIARARVTDFWGGVYKQFVVRGPAKYVVRIGRNRSSGTRLQGLFFDKVNDGEADGKKPLPGFENAKYELPDIPEDADAGFNGTMEKTAALVESLDDGFAKSGLLPLQVPLRVWAYRAAVANNAPAALLSNWRWQLGIWTQEDRDAFQKATETAYKAYSAKHPPKKDEKATK